MKRKEVKFKLRPAVRLEIEIGKTMGFQHISRFLPMLVLYHVISCYILTTKKKGQLSDEFNY